MTEVRKLVVVGGSLAGLRAAEAARRAGYSGAITLIGAEKHLPYDRPPLSKAFLDAVAPSETTYRSHEQLAQLDVDLMLGQEATDLDPVNRTVGVGSVSVPYDALVVATGASARPLTGCDGLAGVHTLRTLDDARVIRAGLDASARVVVVGAGFIGSEVASSARKRGLDVTIVEAAHTPLVRAVGAAAGALVSRLHSLNGTDLRCDSTVQAIERTDSDLVVRLDDGGTHVADLVVVGIGASPNTQWLEGSGVAVDDGVVCDDRLWTGLPGVYAAGDVARWRNGAFGRTMRLEHWTSAAEQASVATLNALGLTDQAYCTVPYFWSDWYGVRIQMVGIPGTDELRVMGGAEDGRFVALYREGTRVSGALCVGFPALTMKLRRLIAAEASWEEALAFCDAID